MSTERGLDRLTFFTDAIVAIAITLLILPLVDSVPDAARDGISVSTFLSDNHGQIEGFLISFVVIARLWIVHHSIFEHVREYDSTLFGLSLFWGFTIVVLPLPTAIISEMDLDRTGIAFYIGTMTLSSFALTAMTVVLIKRPTIESSANPLDRTSVAGSMATSGLFVVALAVAVAFPRINFWAMFLLFGSWPLAGLIAGRLQITGAAPVVDGEPDAHALVFDEPDPAPDLTVEAPPPD